MSITLVFSWQWLWMTLSYSAIFLYGYFSGWCCDPKELPRQIFGVWLGLRAVDKQTSEMLIAFSLSKGMA